MKVLHIWLYFVNKPVAQMPWRCCKRADNQMLGQWDFCLYGVVSVIGSLDSPQTFRSWGFCYCYTAYTLLFVKWLKASCSLSSQLRFPKGESYYKSLLDLCPTRFLQGLRFLCRSPFAVLKPLQGSDFIQITGDTLNPFVVPSFASIISPRTWGNSGSSSLVSPMGHGACEQCKKEPGHIGPLPQT